MTQLELRRALSETAEASAALTDVNLELETLSGAMAHDLRSPLRHIDSLREQGEPDIRATFYFALGTCMQVEWRL